MKVIRTTPYTNEAHQFHILVVDRDEKPVAAAHVRLAEGWHRTYQLSACSSLGATDKNGILVFGADALQGIQDASLLVSKAGYCATGEPMDGAQRRVVIHLQRGETMHVRVHDQMNAPLAGVHVRVSMAYLETDGEPELGAKIPGADGHGAIFSATTNQDGACALSGLLPGRYMIAPSCKNRVLIQGPEGSAVEVPGPTVELTMADLYVGVLKVVSDRIITYTSDQSGDEYFNPLLPYPMMQVVKRLSTTWEHAVVRVAVLKDPQRTEDLVVNLSLYLEKCGFVPRTMHLVPLREFHGPEVFRPKAKGNGCGAPGGTIHITPVDAAGRPSEFSDLALFGSPQAHPSGHLFFRPKVNVDVAVPAGTYVLHARSTLLRRSMKKQKVVIKSSRRSEVTVTIPESFVRCQLIPTTPYGTMPARWVATLKLEDGRTTTVHGRPPTSVWLPAGIRFQLTAESAGYATTSLSHVLGTDQNDHVLRVELKSKP